MLISFLVILLCKVIISALKMALFLSVDVTSVYQSVRIDCREEMGYMARNRLPFLQGNSSYFGAILNLRAHVPGLIEDFAFVGLGVELGSGSQ